ncbi:MAG TPA: methionine--tRNA ligase [Firmicutes bacterium]|nr:methionine--tRNA ligase [Bacillota bacterium]HAZ22865.1 methionine--tRNA ligase [Bacillota bacterium]HBG43844.1 methionine--tRNA ligase [Bacillota bacterium]HBL48858.1 methionine--tRNA ligase [Bacillota bacterium]HBR25244.1 methionine--tRNA ligase [Bacillota bacterium]
MILGKFYITTPIYYPSDNLHIGHSYSTVSADALARYHRLKGDDVFFLTGTDEHGQKIQRRAEQTGVTPQQYVDHVVDGIKHLWKVLDISYDDFIRTTDERHIRAVQAIFKRLYDQGDIYKSEYEGWYCTPCETFWTERQVKDGNCPNEDCCRPVEKVREESYFFKVSKYADRLLEYIESHPEFIQPVSRKHEMINNFLKPGLEDLCVSRTSFSWGIPVSFDERHVVYVWLDALSSYISALGYPEAGVDPNSLFNKFWPADLHLVGKEIVRFHTIIWPITLMALGLPLPKQVYGHGWLLLEGDKMSKSKGNVIDPVVLAEKYGVDAIRYYLLREVPFGSDGQYTEDALINRINVDLANDLGNLLHRTGAMIEKFNGGLIPDPAASEALDLDLQKTAAQAVADVNHQMDHLVINEAVVAIWKLVGRTNKYIDEAAPWALAKDASKKARLGTVLYQMAESLRITAVLLQPFLTSTPDKIWDQLGLPGSPAQAGWEKGTQWGGTPSGIRIRRGDPIFPRIEKEKEEAEVAVASGKTALQPATATKPLVTIDDFAKLDLRVAKILSAVKVEGADKLLHLQVETAGEQRSIVAGIARHYSPEDLVGKSVVIVANLKPAKLRGHLSEGMLLAASTEDDGLLALVTPEKELPSGSKVR